MRSMARNSSRFGMKWRATSIIRARHWNVGWSVMETQGSVQGPSEMGEARKTSAGNMRSRVETPWPTPVGLPPVISTRWGPTLRV